MPAALDFELLHPMHEGIDGTVAQIGGIYPVEHRRCRSRPISRPLAGMCEQPPVYARILWAGCAPDDLERQVQSIGPMHR